MSRTIQLHPFSVMLGAVTVACAGLLAGGGGAAGPPSPLDFMTVVQIDDGFGNLIDTVRFTGCNVQVVNGMEDTETINGAGNLIVGYNEPNTSAFEEVDRTGSHNIVVGQQHNYSVYGGLVAGFYNTVGAPHASVTGGAFNTATMNRSVVAGGERNKASALGAVVTGRRDSDGMG